MASVSATKEFRWHLNWPILILFSAFLGLFVSLGFWQLERAEQKREIIQQQASHSQATATRVSNFDFFDGEQYQQIELFGRFLSTTHWRLQNQIVDGQVGIDLLQPFMLTNGQTIIVNRGWVPANATVEPSINDANINLQGAVRAPMDLPFVSNIFTGSEASVVEIIPADFPLDNLVADWYLQIAPEHPAALKTHWQVATMPPAKHMGYAAQWFTMAAVLMAALLFTNSNLAYVLGFKSHAN